MPSLDPLAVRIVRRHAAAREAPIQAPHIEPLYGGTITAAELTQHLEPIVGPLARMLFHRPPGGSPAEIGWAAVDPSGDTVSGTLVFHVAVGDVEVTTWAEVSIDPPGTSVVADPEHLRLTEPAAGRVAVEYQRRMSDGLVTVGDDEDPCDQSVDGLAQRGGSRSSEMPFSPQ